MINPNDFFNPRERKVKVSVDVKKIQEELELNTAKVDEMRVSSLQKAVQDFEKWLLGKAIDFKKTRLYVLHYTKYNIEKISFYYCYCVCGTKEAAECQKEELLKGGTSSTICEYDFGKLIKMSDNEFEGLPDLGGKDLARKYREVMRAGVEQNVYKAQNETFAKPYRTYNVFKTRTKVVEKVHEKRMQEKIQEKFTKIH